MESKIEQVCLKVLHSPGHQHSPCFPTRNAWERRQVHEMAERCGLLSRTELQKHTERILSSENKAYIERCKQNMQREELESDAYRHFIRVTYKYHKSQRQAQGIKLWHPLHPRILKTMTICREVNARLPVQLVDLIFGFCESESYQFP